MVKREVKYYAFYKIEDFIAECEHEIKILCNGYKFYFSGEPTKINDINKVVGSKPNFYTHRINLYYDNDNVVFLALYTNNHITVEVLIPGDNPDFRINNFVYGLGKRLKKLIKE